MDSIKSIKNKIIKNKKKKQKIPKAIREQCWIQNFGEVYQHKCYIDWCENLINVFNFQVGHDIPESKGGSLNIDNLKPICSRCNLSMGNKYTIKNWNLLKKKL
jgi:5-methylcytosine-specific restriction endonuclease McrA